MAGLRHPPGLYILFLTEMWERFSYYGMRALLSLYLINYFKWTQEEQSSVYKWYTSLVYFTPIVGGFLADRYLGNRAAVVIGAILMAAGQFLLVIDSTTVFYCALAFLIVGNGFFKPNMATQVGRLYSQNDPRKDGAYTIYYMGVNLGAFLSPIVCGYLVDTYKDYHYGFAAAGFGMLAGLVVYLGGQRWLVEVAPGTPIEGEPRGEGSAPPSEEAPRQALTEEAAERTPPAAPFVGRVSGPFIAGAGYLAAGLVVLYAAARLLYSGLLLLGFHPPAGIERAAEGFFAFISLDTPLSLGIVAVSSLIVGTVLLKVRNGVRDRVLAIILLGAFVVFFWAAYEQAGNVMNIWADKDTDRYLTRSAPPPPIFPDVTGGQAAQEGRGLLESFGDLWNPVPTAWYQSINALAIFVLAPLFSWLWIWLEKRRRNPSAPVKMALGILLMALGFAVMSGAARREDRECSTQLEALSRHIEDGGLGVNAESQVCLYPSPEHIGGAAPEPYHAGRLWYFPATKRLVCRGVLPDTERDRILRDSTPRGFRAAAERLSALSLEAEGDAFRVAVSLEGGARLPWDPDLRYVGIEKGSIGYDPTSRTLWTSARLSERHVKELLVAAADPVLRDALNRLYVQSSSFRVSSWWLFWFYILSTLGELCLSPVGLSVVSKLAPARFATLLMGLWFLTSFFGNFMAGALGETWGKLAPEPYFLLFLVGLGGLGLLLLLFRKKAVRMMHGVR